MAPRAMFELEQRPFALEQQQLKMKGVIITLVGTLLALLFLATPSRAAVGHRDSTACTTCEFVVGFVEGYLKENKTASAVVKNLEKICEVAPVSLRKNCFSIVQQEVPALINYILNTESPSTACTQLGFCSSEGRPIAYLRDGEACPLCVLLVTSGQSYIKAGYSRKRLESELQRDCTFMPTIKDCSAMSGMIFSLAKKLLDNQDPNTICTELNACAGSRYLRS
ncbi:hypothetical protein QOT17_020919 [Balamuthia mandrillaris]